MQWLDHRVYRASLLEARFSPSGTVDIYHHCDWHPVEARISILECMETFHQQRLTQHTDDVQIVKLEVTHMFNFLLSLLLGPKALNVC